MPIRYKVVKRKTRSSAIINGNSHFARKYHKGSTVIAEDGTLGILTFKTKTSAESWASFIDDPSWFFGSPSLMVVKVETIGRGRCINWISTGVTSEELENYYSDDVFEGPERFAPDNTIAYSAVRVLE